MGIWQKNDRKMNFDAKEASTWTLVHFLLPSSKADEAREVTASFAICISNLTAGVGKQVCASPSPYTRCHVTSTLLGHMQSDQVLVVTAEGLKIMSATDIAVMCALIFSV